ncbi:FAD-binding oxidoreductase [Microbispora triticiradicis]|uniref:FAD-binding oxidoreductase n=1 Tax=Microbispora triticiradicis TaxID=2200763 RepID=A0ABX9LRH1_9ACTN|nr:FAD-binding oxidoreductase [Microbispora triticiradicis]RGA06500.1 FAD-binding oxidoreductase [Microbispora triticiradicis]
MGHDRMTGAIPDFDLAVVGAGVVGAMTGHLALERDPGLRLLTLDQLERLDQDVPNATGLSAGLDVPTGRDARQRELAARSTALYRRLRAERPGLPVRSLDTFWLLARGNVGRLRETMAGPVLEEADPDALDGVFPGLRPSGDQTLLRSDGSWRADVAGLTRALLDEQRGRPGCAVWEDEEVTSLRPYGDGFLLAGEGGRPLARCRAAVVATGPWALHGPFGERMRAAGLRIKKVAAFHLDLRPAEGAPVLIFEDDDAFLLPQPESGRWLFSFTSQEWDVSPVLGPPAALSGGDYSEAVRVLRRYAPALAGALSGGRAFYDGYTRDRLPLVEPVPDHPGVVIAVGGNGSGFRLAPAIAERALGLLTPGHLNPRSLGPQSLGSGRS